MIIELKLGKPVEPVGDCATFYYETENDYFINEIKKYKCPFRLAIFLDDAMEEFDDIKELIRLEPNQKVNLLVNLLAESERMIKDPTLFAFSDKYLEQTNHLDKYGYEIELEESDLTEQSNRGYEMEVDRCLYN